jgi:hypothetical protein
VLMGQPFLWHNLLFWGTQHICAQKAHICIVWPVVHHSVVLASTVGCTLLFSDCHQNSLDPRRLYHVMQSRSRKHFLVSSVTKCDGIIVVTMNFKANEFWCKLV